MMSVVFVSVNKSYEPGMNADELARVAHKAWPITLATGQRMDHLVAVLSGQPLMAWPVIDAYATDETYRTNGGPRPRIGFALGGPVPVRPEWNIPLDNMRRGVMYVSDR